MQLSRKGAVQNQYCLTERCPCGTSFFFKLPLAIFRKMVYTVRVVAGVMGSEGSAACGGKSDPSEWLRSTRDEGF